MALLKRKNRSAKYNPNSVSEYVDSNVEPIYSIVFYDGHDVVYDKNITANICLNKYIGPDQIAWIDMDGLRKDAVLKFAQVYNIHPLIADDILSVGQRAKIDEIDGKLYCLVPMLYYDDDKRQIYSEQLSLVVGETIVLTFQNNPSINPFDKLKVKLENSMAFRNKQSDFLLYLILDSIVDRYFLVLDKLEERLTQLEDAALGKHPPHNIVIDISRLRHDVMSVKRMIAPVRDVINGLYTSKNTLIEERNKRFFKDVLDHIILAIEYNDNYREITVNIQDLYMNQVNTRMNEIMKILTVVTVLLAPATVIGSIMGMNFEHIPFVKMEYGFYYAIGFMFLATFGMVIWFRKKGWF